MSECDYLEVLKQHAAWQRGEDVPAINPVMLGEAIALAVFEILLARKSIAAIQASSSVSRRIALQLAQETGMERL